MPTGRGGSERQRDRYGRISNSSRMLLSRTFKLCLALGVCFLLALGGCGGGTMGTQTGGNRQVTVAGSVESNGTALAGTTVLIEDDDGNIVAETETNNDGLYAVSIQLPPGVSFSVTVIDPASGDAVSVPVPSPDSDGTVVVDISLGGDADQRPTPAVSFTPRSDGASPTPTPSPPRLTPAPSTPTPPDDVVPPAPTGTPTAVPTTGGPCPAGSVYNPKTGGCDESTECPPGTFFNPQNDSCQVGCQSGDDCAPPGEAQDPCPEGVIDTETGQCSGGSQPPVCKPGEVC